MPMIYLVFWGLLILSLGLKFPVPIFGVDVKPFPAVFMWILLSAKNMPDFPSTVKCTLYTVNGLLETVKCRGYIVHCTLNSVHCALCTENLPLYTMHHSLNSVKCTPNLSTFPVLYPTHWIDFSDNFTKDNIRQYCEEGVKWPTLHTYSTLYPLYKLTLHSTL